MRRLCTIVIQRQNNSVGLKVVSTKVALVEHIINYDALKEVNFDY